MGNEIGQGSQIWMAGDFGNVECWMLNFECRAGIWAWYLWRAILEMLDVGC